MHVRLDSHSKAVIYFASSAATIKSTYDLVTDTKDAFLVNTAKTCKSEAQFINMCLTNILREKATDNHK